eukprot:TRINITY_DN6989_c0_g1_i1.p1 TRINITY_DN6989_c0_g1~~TRINITY_DN6989_c0_g1_i1.p1  ORF type:complete len:177 (-),score=48.61 TRINITY_DN6989_c0_g1_i1:218-748(-)
MPSHAVTKSSHYVSVQQTSSVGGATSGSRYLSWSIGGKSHYFCSLQGILRILELVLVLIVLILARVGDEGNILHFGGADADFIGIGASVGLTFILLAFIVCHLVGHLPPTLLEVLINLVGAILLLTAGSLAISYHSPRNYQDSQEGLALGVIAIIAGIVFAIDFLLSLRHMKISIG